MTGSLARGLLAGAVGTTASNLAAHLDMALRGRPAGSVPDRLVDAVALVLAGLACLPGRDRVPLGAVPR